MKTGLSKKQKATNIYFNEADSMIEVCTYNTALKNRLTEYAGKYPSECRLIDSFAQYFGFTLLQNQLSLV